MLLILVKILPEWISRPDVSIAFGLAQLPTRFSAHPRWPRIRRWFRTGEVASSVRGDLVRPDTDELGQKLQNFYSWNRMTYTYLIHKGKYCMDDLLFDWFGFSLLVRPNPNQSNRRSAVQWDFSLRSMWVFSAVTDSLVNFITRFESNNELVLE